MTATSTTNAVCIRCGTFKLYARDRCVTCGFAPSTKTDLAKSFILSTAFDVGEKTIGRPAEELSPIARSIAQGDSYQFSASEVATVEREVEAFQAVRPRRLALDLLKWIVPPVLLLVIVYALLWAT